MTDAEMKYFETAARERDAMKQTLISIANYVDPDDADDGAEEAGLDTDEFISMAYENVIGEAQHTLKTLGYKW